MGSSPDRTALALFRAGTTLLALSVVLPLCMPLYADTQSPAVQAPEVKAESAEAEALLAAAVQGSADAQYRVGVAHRKGQGVLQNHEEAVRWFRLAADQGHAPAQFLLGSAYHYGLGAVQQDVAEAVRWYRRPRIRNSLQQRTISGTCT